MTDIAPQWAALAPGASGLIWHLGAETDLLNLQRVYLEVFCYVHSCCCVLNLPLQESFLLVLIFRFLLK